jgi:Apea-like HEPN
VALMSNSKEKILEVFRNHFQFVGTEAFLNSIGKRPYSLRWGHRIWYAEETFSAGSDLQDIFNSGFGRIEKDALNYSSCWNLFKLSLEYIYLQKKELFDAEDRSFLEILDPDLERSILKFIEDKTSSDSSDHLIYVNTQFISINESGLNLNFGDIEFRKLMEVEIENIASRLPIEPSGLLANALRAFDENKITYRQEFKSAVRDRVFCILKKPGIQIGNEFSFLIENAVELIRNSLGYLHCMEELLLVQNPPIEFTTTNHSEKELVYIFLVNQKTEEVKFLDNQFPIEAITKKLFKVDSECLEKIEQIGHLSKLNGILNDVNGGALQKKIITALHWFYKSKFTENRTDAILFGFICFESLFSTNNDPTASLSDQIAENAAIMVFRDAESRFKFKSKIKKGYGVRSAIVHQGKKVNEISEYKEMFNLPFVLTLCLIKFFKNYEEIKAIGTDLQSIRKYFDLNRMKGPPV